MKNIEHHPFFLGLEARLFYYINADTSSNYMTRTSSWRRKTFENAIKWIPFPCEDGITSWSDRVYDNEDIYGVYNYNPIIFDENGMSVIINYARTDESYLRFCKNVALHMRGKLQSSVAKTFIEVQRLWPGFQSLLHEAMVDAGLNTILTWNTSLVLSFL
ncbi:hypothetical protein Droror1_Dr00011468 [Drosera rotundifolia]